MVPEVVEVRHIERYTLWIRFSDGAQGAVDLGSELWGPMFEPLKDVALFAQASVHPELRTVSWPNGADLAPEFLYQALKRATATSASG
jgi:hypothetical protein